MVLKSIEGQVTSAAGVKGDQHKLLQSVLLLSFKLPLLLGDLGALVAFVFFFTIINI